MTIRQKPKWGEAAPRAPTPNVARFVSKAPSQYALDAAGSTEYRPHTAVDAAGVGPKTMLLFEQGHRGDVWRLEVCEHEGRIFANWRKWYWDGDTMRPTRQGITLPVPRLADLHEALGVYLASSSDDPQQR